MRLAGANSTSRTPTERWRAEVHQRWPYGLGVVVVVVLLPLAAGYPDPRLQFGYLRGEVTVAIVSTVVFASLLLLIAAAINRTGRAAWFAAAGVVLIFTHPILDTSFDAYPQIFSLIRTSAAATVIVGRGLAMNRSGLIGRIARSTGILLAALAALLGMWYMITQATPRLEASVAWSLAAAAVAIGAIDFIVGQRETDGAATSLGMTMLSFGFGGLLLLASGGHELTVGAATIAIVTAVCAVAAGVVAVFEALAKRETRQDAIKLSEALAVSRLGAQSEHFAQVAHDQMGALLAIEAAAERLREQPSDELAAAVAAEAARLRRSLRLDADTPRAFDLHGALQPMIACARSLGGDISLLADEEVSVWGPPDEVVEIIRSLVDNARVHGIMPIDIELCRIHDEAVVVVVDSGSGVPEVLRETVFERGVTTNPELHSGLGLYAARRTADSLGGELHVSALRPAAFVLHLPVGPPPAGPDRRTIRENRSHPVTPIGLIDSA